MDRSTAAWRNTTHDWARSVDADHLARIRQDQDEFAPGGLPHLLLEVVAYAADEARCTGAGRCSVTLHADGSVSVADEGRGTDTRLDDHGRPVKKPIMATKDLRFFDHPEAQTLPDGHPRRGMSVVAALSEWLVHTNRRAHGAWVQRYEHGVPTTGLTPIADAGPTGTTSTPRTPRTPRTPPTTGTTVHFRPTETLRAAGGAPAPEELAALTNAWPHLSVEIDDRRTA
ncbi:DNA gyrase [Streptomyces sp. WM6372]|uniref:DNA gyrase n=1 Tax=Streptomyces sp. WM6372 TaxID=1415555 RepID=UPI0006ADCFCD|nr:DNA gyrase [Streptomyces sp. WM6372]KOU16862.1 DNA gyrase [Streptomyces sp. WM6372]